MNNEYVTSVFLHGKTYELTWRHGQLKDLHVAWIAGGTFNFIQKFLKPRSFKVKVNEVLSYTKSQAEGIHQASMLRLHFFY